MFKITEVAHRDDWGFGISLMTPYEWEECDPRNQIHLRFWKTSVWIQTPAFIKPRKRWVDLSKYDWATVRADGRKGYVDDDQRQYGVTIDAEYFWIYYGVQCNDSEHGHNVKLLAWPTNMEHVRHDAYYADGSRLCPGNHLREWGYLNLDRQNFTHFKDWFQLPANEKLAANWKWRMGKYDNFSNVSVDPSSIFKFYDFLDRHDGTVLTARVNIEEREWVRGKWSWLRFLLKRVPGCRIVRRTMEIEFSDEVGPRKGSWKGGTIGMGFDMLPGETLDECMTRFQAQEKV